MTEVAVICMISFSFVLCCICGKNAVVCTVLVLVAITAAVVVVVIVIRNNHVCLVPFTR